MAAGISVVSHQAEVKLVRISSGVHHQHSQKGPTSSHPNATAHMPHLNGTLGPLHHHHHFRAVAAVAGAAAATASAADFIVCFTVSVLRPFPSRCPLHRLVEHRRRIEHVGHLPSSDPYPCQHSVFVTCTRFWLPLLCWNESGQGWTTGFSFLPS